LESALGLFAKYLPVSSHFERKLKFSENLKQVSESVREAFKWQESFTWEQAAESTARHQDFFFPICFEFDEQPATFQMQTYLFLLTSNTFVWNHSKLNFLAFSKIAP
jgi:hypothetical protein